METFVRVSNGPADIDQATFAALTGSYLSEASGLGRFWPRGGRT